MDEKRFEELVERYRSGQCTPEEMRVLHKVFNRVPLPSSPGIPESELLRLRQQALAEFQARAGLARPARSLARRLLPYAAAVLIAATATTWIFLGDQIVNRQSNVVNAEDILPGGNKATLTLADGRTIDLSEEHEGIIIQDGITYLDGSKVMENEELRMENEGSVLNSITTPKGGQYQITLPDGSKVWLNSASTLKYPSRFSGDTREVVLEGEAFFQVRKSASPKVGKSPAKTVAGLVEAHDYASFSVHTANQIVNVLGTEFNVSAYPDEPETKTTLVEGKVRVGLSPAGEPVPTGREGRDGSSEGRGRSFDLKPGQQAITRARLPGQGAETDIHQVDIPSVIGWKEGFFRFSDNLESILQQVARWYDVEVQFDDAALKNQEIYGIVHRTSPLSDVLKMLEAASDAKFKVMTNGTERRVTVMR